jgi:uncharacterized protein YecT (DUF1311 family)
MLRYLLAALFAVPALSWAGCGEFRDGSTAAATCHARESFERADKQLKVVYQGALKAVAAREPSLRQELIESERAWVVYRAKECKFYNSHAGGASTNNLFECMAELTEQRTQYLRGVGNE